jgi:histidine ammonia-lyase
VELNGQALTLEQIAAVAFAHEHVAISPSARQRIDASRKVVEQIVLRDAVVYGVNTGFGKLSDVRVAKGQLRQLQLNLVRSHACGIGRPLSEPEVRAMMLLRANVLTLGFSGIRLDIIELLCQMLNQRVHAVIPEKGSVGASGDLAPLAHLALALIGEGDLFLGSERAAASSRLAAARIRPVRLGPKEGITLINGTQAHTAVAALAVVDAHRLWRIAHLAGAMSLEALMGTPVAFDARIQEARGPLGQAASAALLRELLRDSEIRESHRENDPRVQDAYCLRCMPQVHGPVLDAIDFCSGLIGRELNASTDNPLVFADTGELLSGGNFHGQAVAMALDVLAIALTNLATISERRIDRLVHPDLNQGLPPFLSSDAGVNSGFMMAQVTAAALASECKLLAHPASVDTIPTDGNKEDVVPMAMGAAWKLRRVVQNVRNVLAIELMCAAQGLDYRAPLRAGRGAARGHALVRKVIAPLGQDRVLAPDIAALADAIERGHFSLEDQRS